MATSGILLALYQAPPNSGSPLQLFFKKGLNSEWPKLRRVGDGPVYDLT
eukprot:CAMPEP_0119329916 /NCGR_PEP_ID=MMETSP1333-20130426/77013_1 /TAXON_ID=418940 /ORGANISM="Scyphosphaera apsteinii, Strain RCC1455" /LENGTH=48 /DNA_ID= /DNA_START= /DNA_END= /DNA_ORIENTATION=